MADRDCTGCPGGCIYCVANGFDRACRERDDYRLALIRANGELIRIADDVDPRNGDRIDTVRAAIKDALADSAPLNQERQP